MFKKLAVYKKAENFVAYVGVECAAWLPETRELEKKTRESRYRAWVV